ncbi:MAG: Stk1 family PASTA domain-containing Ser/Thr kinase [Clostridia bacterium]|nr:Stk1 family PASTA domain-containing Ser/Thr kinase [Clostridia bacterium]
MDKFIGKRLDARYEIREIIGVGGMAVVYKAYDCIEDRVVAIKILKEEFVRNSEFLNRFRNESKAIAVLSHPNIVKVMDVSFGDNFQYIVMEYIDGITLKEYIERTGAMPWKNALSFTTQTLHALQHAHDRGIIHRDVKPQNIMLLRDGTIKVTDFGIARFARSGQKTLTDKAIGSVHYISPEQARGDAIDEKADLYSVGVMLYEMLTGKLPFDGESAVSVALMHMQNEARPPREIVPSIPVGLEQIVLRAMQKNPSRRYHSDAEMLRDLEQVKRDPGTTFRYDEVSYSVDQSPTKYVGVIGNPAARAAEAEAAPVKEEKAPVHEYEVIGKSAETPEKKSTLLPILAAIAAVILIVVGGALAFVFTSYFNTGDGEKSVKCPALIGVDYEEAVKKNTSVKIVVGEWRRSEEFAYGQIMEQSPKEGKALKVDGVHNVVTVVVSSGKEAILMPDLQGYNLEDAKAKLLEKQYEKVYKEEHLKVAYEYHNAVAAGDIIRTEPAGNAELNPDTIITLVISKGPEPNMVTMPKVVGKSRSAAEKLIEKAGLRVEVVEADSKIAKGIVLSASCDGKGANEGDKLVYGSTVVLTVSTGNPPVYTVAFEVSHPKDYPEEFSAIRAVYKEEEQSFSKKADAYSFSFEVTDTSGTIKVYVNSDEYETWSFTVNGSEVTVTRVSYVTFKPATSSASAT